MLFSELIKGAHVKLRVDKEKSTDKFFTLITDDDPEMSKVEEFTLPKLKFQCYEPIPDFLDVYVKENKDGYVILGQDLSAIIPRFYKEGEEYDFHIKGRKFGKPGAYEVEDENGLYFTLNKAPEGMARGKVIRCKVQKINNVYVLLKYTGLISKKVKLAFRDLNSWLSVINAERYTPLFNLILNRIPDFSPALVQLNNNDSDWIFTILHIFSQNVTKFFIEAKESHKKMTFIREAMKMATDLCLYIIQKSDYLRACTSDQRSEMQDILSRYVEMFRQYEEAAALISNDEDEAFIDSIFENLKQAGFLYHPSEQFRIMMTILRLRPDLIKSRLTNMFDALHSWPMTTWSKEPFRSALVEQLEIYISENCERLNSVTMNETQNDSENKQLTHIVRSIAIQSLLFKPSDRVDISHNKSMFYRFLSNFRTQDVDDLLYKAVGSILGYEYKGDFTWEDTSKFQLLQEKATSLKGSNLEVSLPPKVYTLPNVLIELRPKELTVKERYATDESSVLPNGLISWMEPKILLNERVRTPNAGKKNDFKAYEEMWANIENSLFPVSDRDAIVEVEIRKTRPEDGENVYVVIDDVKEDYTRSEGHRLRFHCTVVGDEYEGSGWLTSCKEDFVPWLDEKDVPRNYNMELDVFCDDRGIPLVFPAKVKNSGEELHFTMKSQLEECMQETITLNDVSQAVIRHVDEYRRRYVCLSDEGYTLLVDMDDRNGGYATGTVVNVKYIGRNYDHRSSSYYFEGVIENFVKNDDNYSKVLPLKNLMRKFGEEQEVSEDVADQEVIEAQEVMSREEMRELILMLQRRAYAEREYLQAFNYLGLAALLSKALDDTTLRNEIKLHQKLLSQLQYYARNRVVDHEELYQLKDKVGDNAILKKLYTKLEIVASISRPEKNNNLWELTTQEDEIVRVLASLVLSLNMLPEEDSYETVRKGINTQIATMLNVNSSETNLKYYGEEDQHLEFKSSLVFTNKREDHMAARREAQEREILEIICGFLNSQGGTLCIGVNDLGYEAGLAEDLRYRRSRGRKDTLDGMIVDLSNLIFRKFPGFAEDHVRIKIDPEAKKGVLLVEVDAVDRPVALDGTYFVRHSTSTRPKLGRDLEDFLQRRANDYNDFMARKREAAEEKRLAEEKERMRIELEERRQREAAEAMALRNAAASRRQDESDNGETPPLSQSASIVDSTVDNPAKIMTGRHRPNILHNYDLGFVHPACYLHFNADNTVYCTEEDQYNEFDEDKLIVLAIADEETDQMLVCTFDDGTVCRTPIQELIEDKGKPVEFFHDKKIVAVNIARPDAMLLTFLEGVSNNTVYARIDPVSELHLSHRLRTGGKKLCENDYIILKQDICTETWANQQFAKVSENSRRLYGSTLKMAPNQLPEQRMEEHLSILEQDRNAN